ncbi:MAG: alanine--glyoxylate aminotransferase family protein [Eubacterium sp.]|nr:alanine--glyoxylate aminotransferase family protein [Eubacterium sp.]
MTVPKILTPGPTDINPKTLKALSEPQTNPDIDLSFYELYKNVCGKLQRLLNTENDVLIMAGEGILGLEAACCSLTEEGDRVLVIDNGIFGAGFADFVSLYGGTPVIFKSDYEKEVDIDSLKEFLENDHNFKYATVVHCETPSGILNPVDKICPLLKSYGIMTVVDSVSATGGDEIKTDEWKIDIALGASQKALSAPVGLTYLSISADAKKAIDSRKTPIKGFYLNLAAFKNWYENKWFPYTMPIHLINALDTALDVLFSDDYINRHKVIGEAVRAAVKSAGLEIYAESGFSNTVTAMIIPEGADFKKIQRYILDNYSILIGSSIGYLENKVIRLGHMGENATKENMYTLLKALTEALKAEGVGLKCDMHTEFLKEYEKNEK